jgi:hypothetical protein
MTIKVRGPDAFINSLYETSWRQRTLCFVDKYEGQALPL